MSSWVVMSLGVRVLERCVVMPLGRRSPLMTVTSNGSSQRLQKPQRVIAEAWLRAAAGPQASTAAAARSSGVVEGLPTP